MIDRSRLQKYYERVRSYSRDRSQNYYEGDSSYGRDRIIVLFRTMEIGENIKIIIKTNIGLKSSTIEIDLMTKMSHIVEIDCKTTVEMNIGKKIIGISKIRDIREIIAKTGHIAEIGHIVEIDCEAIIENLKTRDMREGLKTIIKTGMARIIIEIVTKTKISTKNKDRYKNDSCGKTSGSKERDYLYDADDIFHSEIERVYKILQTMSPEKEMAIGFILSFSVNPDKILDSIRSPADVEHLIVERIECGRNQEDTNLKTKDPHVNISNTSS